MTGQLSTLDAEYAAAVNAVAALPRDAPILLVCHVNPDGDALGSMLGVGLGLRQLGFTQVRATFPEPFVLPAVFDFLPGLKLLVPPSEVKAAPTIGFSFDAASVGRLGSLATVLGQAQTWVMLDHHASNPGFGTVRLLDPGAASTASVAAELLDRLHVVLNRDIATALYVGLVTDTGSFKFDSTTAEVLRLAARLVEAGAAPAEIARVVFDTRPYRAIELLTTVLARAELDPHAAEGRGLISAYATLDDLRRHGQSPQALESFMDVIRTAAEADVACLVKPVGTGEWAVSLRSKGATDVARVAVALGGGGHRLAAGFTGYGEVADILAAVRTQLNGVHHRATPAIL